MIVLVTGATGFLGRPLCAALTACGHAVRILSRNPDASGPLPSGPIHGNSEVTQRDNQRTSRPPRAFLWNSPGPVPPVALDGVQAVIHLAGEPIGAWPWTSARMRAIADSRILGTRALVDSIAALKSRPATLISGSAVGFYGDGGDKDCREGDVAGRGFLAEVVAGWEREAFRAVTLGLRVTALRTGIVLDAGGGALAKMAPAFRVGGGAVLGSGRQWWSWIHLRDAVSALVFALENDGVAGPVNLTAPEPVTQKEFAVELAKALRRCRRGRSRGGPKLERAGSSPWLWPVPASALRLGLGKMSDTLLMGQRAMPQKLHAEGYRFEFPTLSAALENIYSGKRPR